jgi:hypothetical protein
LHNNTWSFNPCFHVRGLFACYAITIRIATFSKAHAVAAARSFLKETVLGISMKERDNKSRDYQVKNPANS